MPHPVEKEQAGQSVIGELWFGKELQSVTLPTALGPGDLNPRLGLAFKAKSLHVALIVRTDPWPAARTAEQLVRAVAGAQVREAEQRLEVHHTKGVLDVREPVRDTIAS
jgi:hypothetical protein